MFHICHFIWWQSYIALDRDYSFAFQHLYTFDGFFKIEQNTWLIIIFTNGKGKKYLFSVVKYVVTSIYIILVSSFPIPLMLQCTTEVRSHLMFNRWLTLNNVSYSLSSSVLSSSSICTSSVICCPSRVNDHLLLPTLVLRTEVGWQGPDLWSCQEQWHCHILARVHLPDNKYWIFIMDLRNTLLYR